MSDTVNIENGKTYLVSHERKGKFTFRCDSQDDTFAYGYVVAGSAMAMNSANRRDVGEEVSMRKDFIKSAVVQP